MLGDVYVKEVNVTGLLNSIPISAFTKKYKFLGEGRHLLEGTFNLLIT